VTGGKFERFLPLSGVLAGLFFLAGFPLSKLPSDPSAPGVVAVVQAHRTLDALSGVTAALCAVSLLYFVTAIRMCLRSGEAGEATYSSAAYGGGVVLAGVIALDACLRLTVVDAAGKSDRTSVAAIGWLEADLWVMFSVAATVFLVSPGLGARRAAALPRWLCMATVALGLLSLLGPLGFITFFALPVWLVATGVVLLRTTRDRRQQDLAEPAARLGAG
jgi:hypothetical protein